MDYSLTYVGIFAKNYSSFIGELEGHSPARLMFWNVQNSTKTRNSPTEIAGFVFFSVIERGSGTQAVNIGGAMANAVGTIKKPVSSGNRSWAQSLSGLIHLKVEISKLKASHESMPIFQSVARFATMLATCGLPPAIVHR